MNIVHLRYQWLKTRAICTVAALIFFTHASYGEAPDTYAKRAVDAYHAGRQNDAVQILEVEIARDGTPQEKWSALTLLTDICTYTPDHDCLVRNLKPLIEAANTLSNPTLTRARQDYVFAYALFLERDFSNLNKFLSEDFSLTVADPINNPVLAARLFILNAQIKQFIGKYTEARLFIKRAFAAALRINGETDAYSAAAVFKDLIVSALASHDVARANRWVIVLDPYISSHLPHDGFSYAEYERAISTLFTFGTDYQRTLNLLAEQKSRMEKLQLANYLRDYLLGEISIQKAAVRLHQGLASDALQEVYENPTHVHKDEILKRGAFINTTELMYAAAEIFFQKNAGEMPDQRWEKIFKDIPQWPMGQDQRFAMASYRDTGLALLRMSDNRTEGLTLLKQAGHSLLQIYVNSRADPEGFPIPSMFERIILGVAVGASISNGSVDDEDLVVAAHEVLGRNLNYVISDTLAALASQNNLDSRRALHAELRVIDEQANWEVVKVKEFLRRSENKGSYDPKDYSSLFSAAEFSHTIQRFHKSVSDTGSYLPTAHEVKSSLSKSEALIGYVISPILHLRFCINTRGIWASPLTSYTNQTSADLKILTLSLSAQYAPSIELDSQYPVEASIRTYHLLFDGLEECLKGVSHLIINAPPDVAGIPITTLLQHPPPHNDHGYDLSKAHWLVYDYAVTNVTSILSFLSSRNISHQGTGDLAFLGIGNPELKSAAPYSLDEIRNTLKPIPETGDELKDIKKYVQGPATLLLGPTATEENFRLAQIERYQIIHFATHALLPGIDPAISEPSLVLTTTTSDSSTNDGLLTSKEIANLVLRAKLVVLSACNTANFDPSAFVLQLRGLSSAFAVAGVPTTVGALWSVDSDTSRRIMTAFYREAFDTPRMGVAFALQKAMINTISTALSAPYYHPRFWAPFVVFGDGLSEITPSPPTKAGLITTNVRIEKDGGEVVSAAGERDSFVTSEIGPIYEARHSSILTKLSSSGNSIWKVEDKNIGASHIVETGGVIFAAGYLGGEHALPLIRALDSNGKEIWNTSIPSRFDGAVIEGLYASEESIYTIVAPLNDLDKVFNFDLVRLNKNGKVLNQRSFVGPASHAVGSRTYAIGGDKSHLVIAANFATHLEVDSKGRDDFGLVSLCDKGGGVQLYDLDRYTLSSKVELVNPDTTIRALLVEGGRIFYAGGTHDSCLLNFTRPEIGQVDKQMKITPLWRSSAPFSGILNGLTKTQKGYLAVGTVEESLSVEERHPNKDGLITSPAFDATKKDFTDPENKRVEGLLIEIGSDGSLNRENYVGNGYPLYLMGLVNVGGKQLGYGSNGFNPMIATLQ